MENGITFELSQDFEQKVFDFIIEMLQDYDDKTESASYVIGQICAAAQKIDEESYCPTDVTVDGFLENYNVK